MNQRRPEPGSSWARHCPDAWPREWLDATGELPPGFTRAAEQHEADLIIGRITEAAFLRVGGRILQNTADSGRLGSSHKPQKRKPNAVVVKLFGYRRFFESLPNLDPKLSPGAVSVWCWLWTCARKGFARSSVRKLANRFRVTKSTAGRWLTELTNAGFVEVRQRGRMGQSPSLVRVRPNIPRTDCDRPAGGTQASR